MLFLEPRTKKHIKGYKYLSFARNLFDKYQKTFLDTTTKRRLDAKRRLKKTVKRKPVPEANFVQSIKVCDKKMD